MTSKTSEFDRLNRLIQTCVESGIYQFYSRWESYLSRSARQKFKGNTFQTNSNIIIITMENVWIYVYGYFLAIGLCTVVFAGEILHFHRERISRYLRHMLTKISSRFCRFATAAADAFGKLSRRVQKMIHSYSVMRPRWLGHTNRITPTQEV